MDSDHLHCMSYGSNQPELAAFFLALRDTLIQEPLLYLCDNQSLLKAVNRWIGEGAKATLVGAPDTDILAADIEILRKKIAAGRLIGCCILICHYLE